ncbi:Pregnancy-associated glycoprotein 2 [Termitomyces sp. J132]|nr:hypothetical protein H2248_007229 [Termitomyces sp. 'cryptogamus']KNZ73209.1 Pregnancy-associated glycoprotein 2 [Termitomyces sp. J132]
MRSIIPFALLLTTFDATYGIRLPFEVRTDTPPSHISRRSTNIGVKNLGNAQYIGNVTIGGVQARVLLDTGSSDLWVNFPTTQPTSTDLGKSIKLSYAVGAATGNVHAATVQIGNYSVDNQAFLLVADTSSFSTNIHAQGYDGLLGLGPNKGSLIYKKLDGDTGDTVLTHIFEQDTSADAYITFLLDRKNAPSEPFTGQLTISELVEGFENITSMPKLDVDKVNKLLSQDQHWQAITDKDVGIMGPDGNPIQVDSIVPSAPDDTYVAVFDSGFTFNQVPRKVSDAIYGRVQGAVYDEKNEYWTIPCGQYLNISISFGGVHYPVHPLDTVDDNFNVQDASGNRVCIGAFQPITSAFSLLGHYDMILGMSFLRNAYTLLDFGSWADGADGQKPYIQLASVTNSVQARQDFVTARLGGVDTINDSKWALLPTSQMQRSPISAEEKKKAYEEKILSRWPYILVGCLVGLLLIVGCCIWRFCCSAKAKARRAKKNKKASQLFATEPESTAYLPLESPYKHSAGHSQSQFSLNKA